MMRRAPPLFQEVLDACIKPLPFNLPVDLEVCPLGKEGNWRNLIHLCKQHPHRERLFGSLWGWGWSLTHKDRNVTVCVRMDDVNELCISGI